MKEKDNIKKYRPSSGTEGMIFNSHFCERCKKDQDLEPCEIIFLAMSYDVDEPEYPKEWIIKNNKPMCTAFEKLDNYKTK